MIADPAFPPKREYPAGSQLSNRRGVVAAGIGSAASCIDPSSTPAGR
jgi:hypothetical protein